MSAFPDTCTVTGAPVGEYLIALPTRLLKAWNSSLASPWKISSTPGSMISSMTAAGELSRCISQTSCTSSAREKSTPCSVARRPPSSSCEESSRWSIRLVMRRTATRIRPQRSPRTSADGASFMRMSRCAWPSITLSGVRNSCEAIETKLRWSTARRRSFSSVSSSIVVWAASAALLRSSSIVLSRKRTTARAISPISSLRPAPGIST